MKEEEKQLQRQVTAPEKEMERNLSNKHRRTEGVSTILIGLGIAGIGALITAGTRLLAAPGETYSVTIGLFGFSIFTIETHSVTIGLYGASIFVIGKGLWQIARSFIQRE